MARDAVEHARREQHAIEADWHRPWLALALIAGVGAVLAVGLLDLPRETAALPAIARHAVEIALPTWGTTEPVNEIVYGSRGFDTFGETFLLLAAVIAVTTLTRSPEPRSDYVGESSAGRSEQRRYDPKRRPSTSEAAARQAERAEEDEATPMTVIVRVAVRTAVVLLAVAAVYLAAWGYTPGGGFPAGAALAGVAILLYAALGYRAIRPAVRPSLLEPAEMLGAALIVAVGLVGLAVKDSFLANWLPLAPQQTIRSGGTLQVFSGAELIEVATGLTIAVFALLGMRHDWAPDE